MSNLFLNVVLLYTAIVSVGGHAEALNPHNVVGTYEAQVVFPSADLLKFEAHVTRFELKPDGTLVYTEYHDLARTKGLLGTAETPSCPGTYAFKEQTLEIVTDCSAYTARAESEFKLEQVSLEELRAPQGKIVTVLTSMLPSFAVRILLKKIDVPAPVEAKSRLKLREVNRR